MRHIQGDILDVDWLKSSMGGHDIVFHTAAVADIDEAAKIPAHTMSVNVTGTANCLQAAVECGVKRFIFASSVYTMGRRGSFYRISKVAGEEMCKSFYNEYGLPYTIVKYGSLYGHESNHWNFIYRVCKELIHSGRYHYMSSPDAIREFVHITDACKGTIMVALDPEFANRSVLITGHQKLRMAELFDMISEMIGRDVKITYEIPEKRRHYVYTPYAADFDVPSRINLPTYIDITEGILDCIRRAGEDVKRGNLH
jgi:UDP-glucose 4-epimerase